jgi:Ca2+-transporting ATPase
MGDDGCCHGKQIHDLVDKFQTHIEQGPSREEAQDRLRKHGPNELSEGPRPGFLALLLGQFNNFLVIILIVAAGLSILLGEYIDVIAITFIVALNAVVGVIQESKA